MLSQNVPYLIVGAGPVGLTAALELNRRGLLPTIIDNDGEPTPESRALAINPRSLEIFEPSGVTDKLITAGNKIKTIVVKQNKKEQLRLKISDLKHRHNYLLVLPQSETEKILIDHLKQQTIPVHWYTELKEIRRKDGQYLCTLSQAHPLSDTNQTISLMAHHLIGADGAHSMVRKQLGLAFDGESHPAQWSLADVHLKNWAYSFDHAVLTLTEQGPIAFFPIKEGFGRIVSSQPDILDNLPEGMEVEKVDWQSGFKISYRQVKNYQKNNAFLAGDAAHIHSPAGGRGMNLGLEDAATLAYLLASKREKEYTKLRHPIGERILKMTEQQTQQVTSSGWMRDFLIYYVAPLMLSIPPIKQSALRRLAGLDTPKPEWLSKP